MGVKWNKSVFGTHTFTWVKYSAMLRIMKEGYDVHYGEIDTIYVRDALK